MVCQCCLYSLRTTVTQQTLTPRTPNLVWGIIDISDMPKRFRLDVEQVFAQPRAL